jgi:hypothetical protein
METGTQDKGDEHAGAKSLDLSFLWMIPLLLLAQIRAAFSNHAQRVKALRGRELGGDPEQRWQELRQCEWLMRFFLSRNARRLLAGEAIDLADRRAPWAPADWTPPRPKTDDELCLRFAFLARIWSDPERYIRRMARRMRAASRNVAMAAPSTPADSPPATAPDVAVIRPAACSTTAIRAPPQRGLKRRKTISSPWLAPARSRRRALTHPWRDSLLPSHRSAAARCA